MKQVKCVDKIRNRNNVITHYVVVGESGVLETVSAQRLKAVISNGQVHCINLKLTSNGRLVDSNRQYSVNLTPVELYKEYINNCKKTGTIPDAKYSISGNDVLLEKVLIKTGIFVIRPFVTKLGKNDYGNEVFGNCVNIKIINKSQITDMSNMFNYCGNLQNLDLSKFDTSNVTDMFAMFGDCENLKTLDLSHMNTSQVTDMQAMFGGCRSLESIKFGQFDTSKVTIMSNMFECCINLKSLDLSSFNTSQVVNMVRMFHNCTGLTSLNLSSFDTSNVTDMQYMFSYCYKLKNLDLSHFNISQLKNATGMFKYCNYEKTFRLPTALGKEINY